ncbi:MAG: S8 family peptidase, partial [Pseudomonadota bacterium]
GAAGGGGGGGGVPDGGAGGLGRTGPTTVTPRLGGADFAAEAARNYGLAAIGADAAHAAGRTGAGVKVAVIDTGIDLQHEDFAGAIDPASIDIVSGDADKVDDQGGHGTAVAGVIGARRDGHDALGVAPDSTLLAVRADATGSCGTKCSFYHSDLARATDHAVANGGQILNYSLGGDSLSANFQAALAAATAQGRIIVAAAGNSAGDDPINPARWAAGGGGGLGLAVGAVDATNSLASFSNRAGASRDFFLVAPGVGITTSRNGGGVRSVNGTSFAAPHVAGAAAVVWGASPHLTGQQVVDILLQSATDLGAAGTDEVYGRGLLNLDAALQPLGEETVPTGATVAEGGAPLAATGLALGAAFGDTRIEALGQSMFVDSYGRPFRADLSEAVRPRQSSGALSSWLDQGGETAVQHLGGGVTMSLTAPEPPLPGPQDSPTAPDRQPRFAVSADLGGQSLAAARGHGLGALTGLAAAAPGLAAPGLSGEGLGSPFLSLAGDGTAMAVGQELGDGLGVTLGMVEDRGEAWPDPGGGPERRAMLAEATRRSPGGTVVGVHVGTLAEAEGPLASSGSGALGFGREAETVFTGVFAAIPAGQRATLFGRYGMGLTDGDALSGGLWRGGGDIHSRAFALGASVRDVGLDGDRVSLSLSRPLKVTSGTADLAVPVGRALDGTVIYRPERVELSPSGAQTDLELSWSLPAGEGQRLVLGGLLTLQPGHDADAGPEAAVGAKYRLRW